MYFWTSNEDISASKGDTDTFENALESWDFLRYDGKIFGTVEYSMVPKNFIIVKYDVSAF